MATWYFEDADPAKVVPAEDSPLLHIGDFLQPSEAVTKPRWVFIGPGIGWKAYSNNNAESIALTAAEAAAEYASQAGVSADDSAESAASSLESANNAASSANYKGLWQGKTGAATVPASYGHKNLVWLLNNNLANIALSEPSFSNPDWQVQYNSQLDVLSGLLKRKLTLSMELALNRHRLYEKYGLETKSLLTLAGYTRNSTATYFDAQGILRTALANEPRITYDPITGACLGYFAEPSGVNSITQRRTFDNAVWTNTGCTVTANAANGIDATLNADKIVESALNEQHRITHSTATLVDNTTYTCSYVVKASGRSKVVVAINSKSAVLYGRLFDLATGVSSATVDGGFSAPTSWSIANLGNGWYRVSITAPSATGAGTNNVRLYVADSAGNTTYLGDGTSGIFVDFAQLETGSVATSIMDDPAAPASQVTRAADVLSVSSTNFTSFYNPTEGSIYCEFVMPQAANVQRHIVALSDGTLNNRIQVIMDSNIQKLYTRFTLAGVAYPIAGAGFTSDISAGTVVRMLITLKSGIQSWYVNGVKFLDSIAPSLPVVNRLGVGTDATIAGSQPITTISDLRYFSRALSNEEAVYVTTYGVPSL